MADHSIQASFNNRGNYDLLDEQTLSTSFHLQENNKRQQSKQQSVIQKILLLNHKKSASNHNINSNSDNNYDYYENRIIGGSV